jgi:hypothetical protein
VCTMTIIPLAGLGHRIGFNRDEQRTRSTALPPQVHCFGGRRSILPIDPVSGGTWIGVNDAGLALALLNVNLPARSCPETSQGAARRSRGQLIPRLLHCNSLSDLAIHVHELSLTNYPPFRLVVLGNGAVVEFAWNGCQLREVTHAVDVPLMFASSGLGDHLVEGPRRTLFDSMFIPDGDWSRRQVEFHRHSWPMRAHLSVCMTRTDACTVSCTTITLDDSAAVMSYSPGTPDRSGEAYRARLPFAQEVVP